jgi:hypothetical protein
MATCIEVSSPELHADNPTAKKSAHIAKNPTVPADAAFRNARNKNFPPLFPEFA